MDLLIMNANTVVFLADQEKVLMIPRLEMFKQVVFCPKATVFRAEKKKIH